MTAVNLTVDIHCITEQQLLPKSRLDIITSNIHKPTANVAYRIYINDIMLTERQWCWNDSTIIRENILVDVATNIGHRLYIEPILKESIQATFKVDNLQVVDVLFTSTQINDLTISFTL